jgi:hypothetical protein
VAAAGIVTGDSSVFEEMVASSPKQIRELALASRALIFDVLPQPGRNSHNAPRPTDCMIGVKSSGGERHPGLLVEVVEAARERSAPRQSPQCVADHQ